MKNIGAYRLELGPQVFSRIYSGDNNKNTVTSISLGDFCYDCRFACPAT